MSKIKLLVEIDEETAKYIQGIKEFDCGDMNFFEHEKHMRGDENGKS